MMIWERRPLLNNLWSTFLEGMRLLPLVGLSLAAVLLNMDRSNRNRQFLMPLLGLIYCIAAMVYIESVNRWVMGLIKIVEAYVPFLNLRGHLLIVSNTALLTGFLVFKAIALPILNKLWQTAKFLNQETSAFFYHYCSEQDKWFVRVRQAQFRGFMMAFYYGSVAVMYGLLFLILKFPNWSISQVVFYPVIGLILLGEMVFFLQGYTQAEFMDKVMGEEEESTQQINFGKLQTRYHHLFKDRILHQDISEGNLVDIETSDLLRNIIQAEDAELRLIGAYFNRLKKSGERLDRNYMKATIDILQGKDLIINNPFYKDFGNYLIYVIRQELLGAGKVLFITARQAQKQELIDWLRQLIFRWENTDNLWRVGELSFTKDNWEIGVMAPTDYYNTQLLEENKQSLDKVGLVILIENSHILAVGQIALSILAERYLHKKNLHYVAFDRNCDGLVDTLSHTFKINITKVYAGIKERGLLVSSFWKADGEHLHNRLLSVTSRYLGVGTELATVALKYQVPVIQWVGNLKFPVSDMHWRSGQYYGSMSEYINQPFSQQEYNSRVKGISDLWGTDKTAQAFLILEDEFNNLFEAVRTYADRGWRNSYLHVVSGNYLLRQYMVDNHKIFMSDAKAIPTIVPDYAGTKRNTLIKILVMVSAGFVREDVLRRELSLCGYEQEDVIQSINELSKLFFNEEVDSLVVHYEEEIDDQTFESVLYKCYHLAQSQFIEGKLSILKHAYLIDEKDKASKQVGTKLYGQLLQAMLPGQYVCVDGKYYEVMEMLETNGFVLKRASEQVKRRYYRNLRSVRLDSIEGDDSLGSIRHVGQFTMRRLFAYYTISTDGYLEMADYNDVRSSKKILVENIPDRKYNRKAILTIQLGIAEPKIQKTVTLLFNEIFVTTFPNNYPYILAATEADIESGQIRDLFVPLMNHTPTDFQEQIFIMEDSEMDMGLLTAVERNIRRYLEIMTDYLVWHDQKSNSKRTVGQSPIDSETEIGFLEPRSKCFIMRWLDKIRERRSKKKTQTEQTPEILGMGKEESTEEQEVESIGEQDMKPIEEQEVKSTEEQEAASLNTISFQKVNSDDLPVETGQERMEFLEFEQEQKVNQYQQTSYLNFGFDQTDDTIDPKRTMDFLINSGYGNNYLEQAREKIITAEQVENEYQPNRENVHYCDFCGTELLAGQYTKLKDGRERCFHCDGSVITEPTEFQELYKRVLRNMENFFGISINCTIQVRVCDPKKIARNQGTRFVATDGFDARTVGYAQRDRSGYCIYLENGGPRLSIEATIAHELTHIWQYLNWNDREINRTYGKKYNLQVYEGMAKWVEIQYLFLINEVAYGKRQEISTRGREDEYGRGFMMYLAKYPLSYGVILDGETPFKSKLPL